MNDIQMLADIAGMVSEALEKGLLVNVVRCKNCMMGEEDTNFYGDPCVRCYNSANGVAHVWHKPDWFCADGKIKNK